MKKIVQAGLVGLSLAAFGLVVQGEDLESVAQLVPVEEGFQFSPELIEETAEVMSGQVQPANLGVSLGDPNVKGETLHMVVKLAQQDVREKAISNLRRLRGEMWDKNPPYNSSTLRQEAARYGLTSKEAYVNAISWDVELEKKAIQRAVEAGLVANHIRPDGSGYDIGFENLAWGYSVTSAVYNGWGIGELDALIAAKGAFTYDNGHLHNQLNPNLKSFAVASVRGTTAQALDWKAPTNPAGTNLTGNYVVPVKFAGNYLSKISISLDKQEYSIGDTVQPKVVYDGRFTVPTQVDISDPSVVDTSFIARSAGSVTFTAAGKSVTATISSTKPVYRLYDRKTNYHFYTSSMEEVNLLQSRGWTLEGTAWKVSTSKEGNPIYRVWNTGTGERIYTRHWSEVEKLVSRGWKNEGIAFYSKDQGKPIYRLRNKRTGKYLLTLHQSEVAKLVAGEWQNEGVAWYSEP